MEAGIMGTNRSISLLLLIVSGTAGIAALFLDFTWKVSPAEVVFDAVNRTDLVLLLLAIPFFLTVLVSAASVRWMISGLLSRPERAIAYVASSMMAFCTLFFIIFGLIVEAWPFEVHGWLVSGITLLMLLFGGYVVIKNLRNKGPREVSAVMAMQIAYLSNALLCLISSEGWQIGAYFVVVTSIVYLLQIVLVTVKLGVFRRGGTNSSE